MDQYLGYICYGSVLGLHMLWISTWVTYVMDRYLGYICYGSVLRLHTARTARFSKKSLRSDIGEIKKMSEKLKKKSVLTPRKIEHGDLL
jgi:hypothetical protein